MASDEGGKDSSKSCTNQPTEVQNSQLEVSNKDECEQACGENFKVPDTGGDEGEVSSDMEVGSNSSLKGACGSTEDTPIGSFEEPKELINFKMIFNKEKHSVCFPLDETILGLKKHIETIIGVPPSMQKVMYKGLCKDEKTLRDIGFVENAKVMVVGSTLTDILAVNTPTDQQAKDDKTAATVKEPLCKQKLHKKILDKGIPEDAQPGIKNAKDSLPPYPLSGMVNKSGGKVRLTFKLEMDQVWIGTKERTDKIPMNSIKNIVSEVIEDHDEYHIVGLQLGTTEASIYWLYWVPAQYVDAIKDAILGKWQYF